MFSFFSFASDLVGIVGPQRAAYVLATTQQYPEASRQAAFDKYSAREIAYVVDAMTERQRRIEQAIRTAKRAVVIAHSQETGQSVAMVQRGRYSTSDGPRAHLEGPYSIGTALAIAEVSAGRAAAKAIPTPMR